MPTKSKTTLRHARERGDLEAFIKEHEGDKQASKPRLLKTLSRMEKPAPKETRKRGAGTSA